MSCIIWSDSCLHKWRAVFYYYYISEFGLHKHLAYITAAIKKKKQIKKNPPSVAEQAAGSINQPARREHSVIKGRYKPPPSHLHPTPCASFPLILRAISGSAGVDSRLSCRVKGIVSPPEPAIMERASLLFPTGSSDKKWVKTPESLSLESLEGRDFKGYFFFFMLWFSFVSFSFFSLALSPQRALFSTQGESSYINSNSQHFKDLIVFSVKHLLPI